MSIRMNCFDMYIISFQQKYNVFWWLFRLWRGITNINKDNLLIINSLILSVTSFLCYRASVPGGMLFTQKTCKQSYQSFENQYDDLQKVCKTLSTCQNHEIFLYFCPLKM